MSVPKLEACPVLDSAILSKFLVGPRLPMVSELMVGLHVLVGQDTQADEQRHDQVESHEDVESLIFNGHDVKEIVEEDRCRLVSVLV